MTKTENAELYQLRCDLQIDDFIDHHKYSYKYPGQEGDQFTVILSILHEMSTRKGNPSTFIRWYSIIINLIESHHRYLSDKPLLKIKQEISTEAPPYLEKLELFLTQICRLGIILSTGKKIHATYVENKLNRIISLTHEISPMIPTENQPAGYHMPFIWTYVLSIQHLLRLSSMGKGISRLEHYIKNDQNYNKMINWTLARSSADKSHYYQIENFWNGFIP